MFTTKPQIEKWLMLNGVENYTINDDLTVDVDGIVNLKFVKRENIPVKFGTVTKHFICSGSTNLEGSPLKVLGSVQCSNILSFQGSPKFIGEDFSCYDSPIKSLFGSPKCIKRNFYSMGGHIESLVGLQYIHEHFIAIQSKKILILETFYKGEMVDIPYGEIVKALNIENVSQKLER